MSKSLAIAIIFAIAFAYQVLANGDPVCSRALGDDRYFITRLFDATQVALNKNAEPTAFVFTGAPGDSIKVDCEGCSRYLGNDATKNTISLSIKSAEDEVQLVQATLGKWIALPAHGGKAAMLIGRNSYGDRQIVLNSLVVFRKSVVGSWQAGSATARLLEVNNLALPKAAPSAKLLPTVFFVSMREEDSYRLQVVGSQGLTQQTMSGYVFKQGEEFAKQPVSIGVAAPLPATGKGNSLFGFSFSELPDSKGTQYYHIGIDRIPGSMAGQPSTQDR